MKKISFIIPCHNEDENVDHLHSELLKFVEGKYVVEDETLDMSAYDWQFLFVNDGSTDETLQKLRALRRKDPRVSVLNLSRNFGKENAMLAGMDYADGDAVINIDADLQDPLDIVPEMVYWWEKGYDDIYGKRLSRGKESRIRKFLSISFYRMLGRMTDIDILPNVGDFRLLDRRAVRSLTQMRETQRYMKGLYCWVGFNKKEVTFDRADREAGKSNFKLFKLINLAIEGITSYTTSPLRYATVSGIFVSLCAFIYLIYILVKTLAWGEEVAGFPTLICVILFLGGMQLLALGIIGEYIGRIFNETKGRPPYIVESFNEERNEPLSNHCKS